MADSILVGPPQKDPNGILKALLNSKRRQSDNEGGAATDFSGQVSLGTYTEAVAAIDEAIAAITAAASHTFNATPTTPYVLGDVWFDGDADSGHLMHRCTTARATGAYVAADWELLQIKAAFVQADVALTSPIITGGVVTGSTVETAAPGSADRVVLGTVPNTGGTGGLMLCGTAGTPATDWGVLQAAGSTVLLASGLASNLRYAASILLFPGAALGQGTLEVQGALSVSANVSSPVISSPILELTGGGTTVRLRCISSGTVQKSVNGGAWTTAF